MVLAAGGDEVSAVKLVASMLIVAGMLGLVYGKFNDTQETHDAKLGPVELSVKGHPDGQHARLGWRGVIAAGVLLLLVRKKS